MRFIKFHVFIAVVIFSHVAKAETSFYVGPLVGSTSYSSTDGTDARDSQFSYGGETFIMFDHVGGGLTYSSNNYDAGGTQAVSVHQNNQWLDLDARYKFWDRLGLFATAGAGIVFQSVTTQVMGESEKVTGQYFSRDVGIGTSLSFIKNVGLDAAAKYYQFSNVNGFIVSISLGYSPVL